MLFLDSSNVIGDWTVVEGDTPNGTNSSELTVEDPPYFRLNNGLIRTDLYRSVYGSWNVSFKAVLSTEQRGLWVGVFNADGTQGLGVKWSSATNAGPEGRVTLLKFDLASEVAWSTPGETISGGFRAGHDVTGNTLAQFSLQYDAGTRMLAASVDGNLIVKSPVSDPAFADFSRVYVRGNLSSYFDDIEFAASRPTPEFINATRFRLNNSLREFFVNLPVDDPVVLQPFRYLPRNVEENWTLTFDAGHSARQRGLWVGLFDESRTKGYGVLWNSSSRGTGLVTIRKFDLNSEVQWEDKGVAITDPVRSGHDPLDPALARIELSWIRATRTLYLSVDGVPRAQVVDDSFGSFARLIMRGNTSSYFDNLMLLSETPVVNDEAFNLVTDGGAVGDGVTDNRNAIMASVAAAVAQGRDLYVPPGIFAYSGNLEMQNVRLGGEGYLSVLKALDPDHRRLHLTGAGGRIANLRLLSPKTTRSGSPQSAAISLTNASDYVIEAVHIEGGNSSGIISHSGGSFAGRIANNWISGVLANGIHLTSGTHDVLLSRNAIEYTGDDGIAVVTYATQPAACHDITLDRNTVYRSAASGIAVGGSHLVSVLQNYVHDCAYAALELTAAEEWNVGGPDDILVYRNKFRDYSHVPHRYTPQKVVHIEGSASDRVENVMIDDNFFDGIGPLGLHIGGFVSQLDVSRNAIGGERYDYTILLEGACADVAFHSNAIGGRLGYSLFSSNPGSSGALTISDNRFSGVERLDPPSPIDVVHLTSESDWDTVTITNNRWSIAEWDPDYPPPDLPTELFMEIHDPDAIVSGNTRPDLIWVGP